MFKRKDLRVQNASGDLVGLWRVRDVAEFLGVSCGHIRNLNCKKKIPSRKVGKLLYFFPEEILEWVELNGFNRRRF